MSARDCLPVCGGLLGVGHDALVGQPVHVAVEQRLEEADDVVVEEEEDHQPDRHHDLRHRPKLYTDEDTRYVSTRGNASVSEASFMKLSSTLLFVVRRVG